MKVKFIMLILLLCLSAIFSCYDGSFIFAPSANISSISAPVISPNGGAFTTNQTVTITSSSPTIQYRINMNGSWSVWVTYSAPFVINTSCIIVAKSVDGSLESAETSPATFSQNGTAPSVSISPNGGAYQTQQTIIISATGSPTSTQYQIDNGAWQNYTAPFTISTTCMVSAKATNAFGTGTAGPSSFLINASYNPGPSNPVVFNGGFTILSGGMTITDNGDQTYTIANSGTCIYNPTISNSNYIITAEIKCLPGTSSYGIMFRMQDTSGLSGYDFQYEATRLRLVYFNNGSGWGDSSMMLNSSSGVNLPNPTYNDPAGIVVSNTADTNWHSFVFVANNGQIEVYMDGALAYTTDTSSSYFFSTSWWDSTHTTNYGIPPTWGTGGLGFRFWSNFSVMVRNWQFNNLP